MRPRPSTENSASASDHKAVPPMSSIRFSGSVPVRGLTGVVVPPDRRRRPRPSLRILGRHDVERRRRAEVKALYGVLAPL